MNTITEHIREHLMIHQFGIGLPSYEERQESEWCSAFEQGMRNRLVLGSYRYSPLKYQDLFLYDFIKETRRRLQLYDRYHNLEYLIDAANMLMIEFIKGQKLGYQMKSSDDGIHNQIIN